MRLLLALLHRLMHPLLHLLAGLTSPLLHLFDDLVRVVAGLFHVLVSQLVKLVYELRLQPGVRSRICSLSMSARRTLALLSTSADPRAIPASCSLHLHPG